MYSTSETVELRKAIDVVNAARKGLDNTILEPVPRQRRVFFKDYVLVPALTFGLAFGLLFVGIVIMLLVGNDRAGLVDIPLPLAILFAFGGFLAFGSVTFFYFAWQNLDEWRQLQWRYVKESAKHRPKEERARVMIATGSHSRRITRIDLDLRKLSRRCHNERGEWKAGEHIRRKLFEEPDLIITNASKNYPVICEDFYNAGWIDDPDPTNNPRWLAKGRAYLRGELRIV